MGLFFPSFCNSFTLLANKYLLTYFDLDDIVNRFSLKNERRMTLMNIPQTDDASNSKHLPMNEDDCLDL